MIVADVPIDTAILVGGGILAGAVILLVAIRSYVFLKKPQAAQSEVVILGRDFWEKHFASLETSIETLDRTVREHRTLNQVEMIGLRQLLEDLDVNVKIMLSKKEK